jgi:hypothetical protein
VIEHREALIYMLCQAAELEHGIMCQYLFAAFSLKQREDEGLTAEELDAVNRWRRTIAHVATEEMLHLALVQNVLSAIGAAPHPTRPNLPAPAHHYPAGVNLKLVPFGEPALQHFMFLERPEGMTLEGAQGIDAPVHEAVPLLAEGDIVPQLQDRLARATSRFMAAEISTEDEPMHFEEDVKPLFRDRDRDSMRFAFDLWSVEDVSTNADGILARLEAGTMPCDGAWPAEQIAVFRRWIDAGKPA